MFRDRKNWSDNIAKKQEIWVRLVECYIHKFIGNSFYQAVMLPDSPLQSPNRQSSVMRMACIMRVASILYEAILDRNVITLRDVYYRDKQLFERQRVVDKIVDDLVATAGLKRRDFYVCASAKGLIASSSLVIRYRTGDEIVLSATRANLIDPAEKIDVIEAPNGLDWVLIVEKDVSVPLSHVS